MEFSDIRLEQIDFNELLELHKYWYGDDSSFQWDGNCARILTPPKLKDYRTLVRDFLDTPYCDQISYNDRGTWKKRYARHITLEDIGNIVDIAQNDRIKKGHIELYFETLPKRYRIKMKFAERDNAIFGYSIKFPLRDAGLFSWDGPTKLSKKPIYALWDPRDTADTLEMGERVS